ncbi:hypothetical protein GCM10025784_05680 [Citricoccus nitrophenolicus]
MSTDARTVAALHTGLLRELEIAGVAIDRWQIPVEEVNLWDQYSVRTVQLPENVGSADRTALGPDVCVGAESRWSPASTIEDRVPIHPGEILTEDFIEGF